MVVYCVCQAEHADELAPAQRWINAVTFIIAVIGDDHFNRMALPKRWEVSMNVTIIGNGNMARGIALRLVHGGHNVTVHARDEQKGNALAGELQLLNPGVAVRSEPINAATDDIVILAVPYTSVKDVVQEYGGFENKILIDITNPVDFETFQLIPEGGDSGAETIAAMVPGARVVKAFNTTLSGALVAGQIEGKTLDVFVAGDDDNAKVTVLEMITTSGMRAIDVGPLAYARHLEGFGLIQMQIQNQIGSNWMSALKF